MEGESLSKPKTGGSKKVFIDLAPFVTASAFQGIGRYLRELLGAFGKLDPAHWKDLEAVGLDTQSWPWKTVKIEELLKENGVPKVTAPIPAKSTWRHRMAGRYLKALGCACYHQPEPHHTPIFAGVPLVLSIHDIIPIEFPHLYSRKAPRIRLCINLALMKFRTLSASHIITGSQYVKEQLQRRFQVPPAKISVAYYGVDLNRFHPHTALEEERRVARDYNINGPYFLYVGTADPRKNLGFLLEAMAASQTEIPLLVAGRIHDLHRPQLQAKLQQLQLGNKVRFLGYVAEDDLPALYRHSLALLFPSLSEGFGLPVVEAMACGTPVVAFANSSIPEVAGDAAWLVPTNDLPAFVEAMKVLAVNHEKRQELVAKGLERAKLFTWENTARAVLGVYRRVLGLPQ
jgi:glycosyltransferase involved in cell wall biosynthesis